MADVELDRVSDGVLVHPVGDGAIVADLITGRAHLVNAAAAWLLSTDATSIDDLVGDLPDVQRGEAERRILDALDTLRTPGLVGREVPLERRTRPSGSSREQPGDRVGQSHPVLAERVAFRSEDAVLVEEVDAFLGSGIDVPPTLYFDVVPNDDGSLDLYTEDDWHFLDDEQFFTQLPAVFNDYAVRSHDVIALHAGAVRTPDGRVLVLLGHMNVGKSTLTAALVAAGCDYFSDETVGIDSELGLVGYPKPISIDHDTHEVLGLTAEPRPHVSPEGLCYTVTRLTGTPQIDEILLVRHDPDAMAVRRDQLESVEALEALCAHTLNLARLGEPGLATLCDAAEKIEVSTFQHPGVEVAVPALLDR